MKMKSKIFIALLFCFPLLVASSVTGCSCNDDVLRSAMIPQDIVYENNTYSNSGDVVAVEKAPQNITYIGRASIEGESINEPDTCTKDYEVYSIQGIDIDEAIAVKFLLVGSNEAYYCYYKYERHD
jgi:hypothetical protein